ncbi:MAG: tetratricopeptide repeat protein [Bacteroidales bacterium]|nr:tetratricopeptide repeat protein [Bacteroidales bacterium]
MRKLSLILSAAALIAAALPARAKYIDHRGYNVDSLENVVGGWTIERLEKAGDEQYDNVLSACRDLMWAYQLVNRERSGYFARKALAIASRKNYLNTMADAEKMIGAQMFGRELYDSALIHYHLALGYTDRMAAGEKTFDGRVYDEETVDDNYSGLYGQIANAYNMQDDIPMAIKYYEKAGEIFEKRGWNESNSILWYNIGETWVGEHEYAKARPAYEKALTFAEAASDSLLKANAYKGLGGLYMDTGKTAKALKYLLKAEEYYKGHPQEDPIFRMENFGFLQQVLTSQKQQLSLLAVGAIALTAILLTLMLVLRRMRAIRKQRDAADAVIDEALAQLPPTAEDAEELQDGEPEEDSSALKLTERENEILPLIAAGLTSPQIADKLCLSLPTIKWYRKKLL